MAAYIEKGSNAPAAVSNHNDRLTGNIRGEVRTGLFDLSQSSDKLPRAIEDACLFLSQVLSVCVESRRERRSNFDAIVDHCSVRLFVEASHRGSGLKSAQGGKQGSDAYGRQPRIQPFQ